jgi:hypothetical protein
MLFCQGSALDDLNEFDSAFDSFDFTCPSGLSEPITISNPEEETNDGASDGTPKVELLFDCSASMSTTIDGERKIDIAKDFVDHYLNEIGGLNIALRLYGHRNEGCTDTELVLPFGSPKSAINTAVQKMEPVGMTPIEYSLRQAVGDLSSSSDNTIVLISDGEETCAGDPCQAVEELSGSRNNFVLYAIGLDISDAGEAQLQCMADSADGAYYKAQNAEELYDAFDDIAKVEWPSYEWPEPFEWPEPYEWPDPIQWR